ncbi:MAG: hypothetical protein BWY50_01215 [Spirochaetes bacterium ADurb.Bin315]|nr:MAG: hypothetical protein BWY50_01215 [Spirochaetes bacterium ADurb.Bin315]
MRFRAAARARREHDFEEALLQFLRAAEVRDRQRAQQTRRPRGDLAGQSARLPFAAVETPQLHRGLGVRGVGAVVDRPHLKVGRGVVGRHDHHRDRRVEAPGLIVQVFPLAAVLEARPGRHRPVVVKLPVQRPHAARLQMAPRLHRRLDRKRLLNLGQVQEIFEPLRKAEVTGHGLHDARVAAHILLVMLEIRRRGIQLIGRGKGPRHLRRGK